MPLKNSTKNNAAFLLGIIWSFGIGIFAVYSFAAEQKIVSIWRAIVMIYSTYKFSGQIRGESRVSLLSFFLIMGGLLSVLAGLAEAFWYQAIINLILVPIGALHVVVGYWAYQNLSEHQSNHLPGLNQLDKDYEIINFTNVGELVSKMKAGDWGAITRGEYKIEVSDAAIQAIGEQTLRRCLADIHFECQHHFMYPKPVSNIIFIFCCLEICSVSNPYV